MCANPISVMESIMGQFSLCNGVLLVVVLVMAMGFVDYLGQYLATLFSLLLGDEFIVPDQKETKKVNI